MHPDDSCLSSRRIVIVGGGPLLAPLLTALTEAGLAQFLLLGDRALDLADTESSVAYDASDVGRPASEALRQRLGLDARGVALEATRSLPADKLAWQAEVRGASLVIALVEGPVLFYPWLDALNEASLDAGTPWMTASLHDGREVHLGPLFVPDQTACHKCYELRYKSNVASLETYLMFERHVHAHGAAVDFGSFLPLAELAASMIALDALRLLGGGAPPITRGALITMDAASYALEQHPVLKLPRCAACSPLPGAPATRAWR